MDRSARRAAGCAEHNQSVSAMTQSVSAMTVAHLRY